jgi:O-antigen ligase
MVETIKPIARAFNHAHLARLADALAGAVVVAIPWSTSATGILVVLWLIAVAPTLNGPALRRELATPAGGLPVAFWLLAACGMLWADVAWSNRLDGLGGFHKLLIVPILLAQFRRSERGELVLAGYLLSCTVLLLVSWTIILWPGLASAKVISPGVPVKDYITQSSEFAICAFAALHLAVKAFRLGRWVPAVALVVLAVAFLSDVFYVATARTTLVVIPFLLVIFVFQRFGIKKASAGLVAGAAVCVIVWTSSPYLRNRVLAVLDEIEIYQACGVSSSGERLEFWKQSLASVATAPLIGHGTGSIPDQLRQLSPCPGWSTVLSGKNPHNQTFAVAIQLGLLGAVVLWAMWVAHLLLFRGDGLAAWIGLGAVAQNVVSSLFNSHIADFTQGWTYMFGVGVLGGMALRRVAPPQSTT